MSEEKIITEREDSDHKGSIITEREDTSRKGWTGHVPPRDKWKVYKAGSPGDSRKDSGITLTAIQKDIKTYPGKRENYQERGLLGPTL